MFYKIPLLLMPQPEGDSVEEVMINVQDALQAVVEAYQDMGRELPFAPNSLKTEFLSTADYVLNKNNELYKRLS